jgi:polysaccharide deacetylase family protein (PEP-CTERM system associated)
LSYQTQTEESRASGRRWSCGALDALTIDVEDWYSSSLCLLPEDEREEAVGLPESVVTNTRFLLDLLASKRARATFFVLGTVAQEYPELVREIARRGHEVASHGYRHRLAYELTPEEFEEDLSRSLELIESASGSRVIGYRAGYFSITHASLWAFDILARYGIVYDSSVFPIRRRLYGIPDAPRFAHLVKGVRGGAVWEIPPSTVRLAGRNWPVAGGGYLRLFPYPLICRGIRRVHREGEPGVVYLHPYEIDPEDGHPGPARGLGSKVVVWTQAMGRRSVERKWVSLLDDFRFGSIRDVFGF